MAHSFSLNPCFTTPRTGLNIDRAVFSKDNFFLLFGQFNCDCHSSASSIFKIAAILLNRSITFGGKSLSLCVICSAMAELYCVLLRVMTLYCLPLLLFFIFCILA